MKEEKKRVGKEIGWEQLGKKRKKLEKMGKKDFIKARLGYEL